MLHHAAAVSVFAAVMVFVAVLGFVAARWRRSDLSTLHEWALAGRRFGTLMSWFLIGGDLYTAYTFIAIPALVYGVGAMGFFGVPYTVLIYPLIFSLMPRLWSVCRERNYVTAADFVHGTFQSRRLSVAIAITGILATMPYIALQLIGIQVVVAALGFSAGGLAQHLPLAFAFVTVCAYTYTSGLRAPAMIAIVKDILIYVTISAALMIIPAKLGGLSAIFAHVPASHLLLAPPTARSVGNASAYATLALGSAVALILYPHSLTAMLSAQSGATLRRNAVLLPAYSLLLGFLSLLGFMAAVAHLEAMPAYGPLFAHYHASAAVPALFLQYFPDWFVGIAFSAIAVGALVPAAIMAIAAANLFTRNIYPEIVRPRSGVTLVNETQIARIAALVVMAGALGFTVSLPATYAVQFQLLGGIWIIQTAPSIILGLLTKGFEARGLFAGWLAGMLCGTVLVAQQHFSAIVALRVWSIAVPAYIAVVALAINLIVAAGGAALHQRQRRSRASL